jgi:hypothetical protein
VLLLLAYVLSFYSIQESYQVVESVKVVWRQLAALAYFYMIVMFVNDERKLLRILKVFSAMVGFVMLTAVWELMFPGRQIIPGWIGVSQIHGQGTLQFRLEGIRVGGAVQSHSMLSDLATAALPILGYLSYRVRNPLEKTLWILMTALTLVAMLSSGNRGAFVAFTVGVLWLLFLLRRQIPPTRMVILILAGVAAIAASEMLLERYSVATSVVDRLLNSEFEGVVPENRTMTWRPALEKGLESPIIGHGPYYETGRGLEARFWPHNAYIYYFYTIGLIGLGAFLWILFRTLQLTRVHRAPGVDGTDLGTIMKLLQVWLISSSIAQLRTDHQRDDIYMFIIWLMIGLVAATHRIITRRIEEGQGPPETA